MNGENLNGIVFKEKVAVWMVCQENNFGRLTFFKDE